MTSNINSRRGHRVALVLLACAALAALAVPVSAAPSGAGTAATYRPDGRIALACQYVPDWQPCNPDWTGDNVYNRTGRNQKLVWTDFLTYSTERDPRVIVFRISIQNDGSVADRFRVDADGVTSGYLVKFFRMATNISSAVEAGTYTTPLIAPGASLILKAKVVMPCDSWDDCGQDRAHRLVSIRSVGDPAARDAVKFIRRIWVCTC